jgi:DNA repair protein RadC
VAEPLIPDHMEDLVEVPGLDKTAAALELSHRLPEPAKAPLQVRPPATSGPRMAVGTGDLEQECLRVVLLDTEHHILAMPTVYGGSVNPVSIRAGGVFRKAVRHNATALIVAHNHPSATRRPARRISRPRSPWYRPGR